jgi:hypothetical protein
MRFAGACKVVPEEEITPGIFSVPRTRVPHIWPGFGQMWELAALEPEILRLNRHYRASIR